MLTLTNILFILVSSHLTLGKDPKDDSIIFPSDKEISMRQSSLRYRYNHHNNFIPKLRNPSTIAPLKHFPKHEEDENFEKNGIPIDIWRETSHIKDPYELRKYFEEKYSNQSKEIHDRFGGNKVPLQKGEQIKCRDDCVIENTRICLDKIAEKYLQDHAKNEKFNWVMPKCVEVKQCGGCCVNDHFKCQATNTKKDTIPVTLATISNKKLLVDLPLEQHLECKCQCLKKENQMKCTSLQKYNSSICSCECTNIKERDKCIVNGNIKIWSGETCKCRCRVEPDCGTGEKENYQTCKCEINKKKRKEKREIL